MNRGNFHADDNQPSKPSVALKSLCKIHLPRPIGVFCAFVALSFLCLPLQAEATTTINEQFNPSVINQGDTSLYTITITNDDTIALTNAMATIFLDNTTLDPNTSLGHITIASGTVLSNTCGFSAITAVAGTSKIVLTGGTIPVGSPATPSICTFSLDVTSVTVSTYHAVIPANTAPDANTSGYAATGNSVTVHNTTSADITLQVNALTAPTGNKTFSPSPAVAGDPITLTITLSNPNALTTMPLTTFIDSLPSGMAVASTPSASINCTGTGAVNGTFAPLANDTSLTLTGGTIGQGGACTLSVKVVVPTITGVSQGFDNSLGSGAIGNTRGLTSPAFNRILTVNSPISVTKSFGASPIPAGQPSRMTITITNNSTTNSLDITTFSDDLTGTTLKILNLASTPVAGGVNPSVTCDGAGAGNGTLTYTADTLDTTLTLTGAKTGPKSGGSGKCVITADVTSTVDGPHTNTIPADAIMNPGSFHSPGASSSLTVNAQLTLDKTVSLSNVAPGQWTRFTVTLYNWSGAPVTNVSFRDDLPSNGSNQMVLDGSNPVFLSTGCSGGAWTGSDGAATLQWSSGTVAAGSGATPGVCSIVFQARLPITATTGLNFSNQIPIWDGTHGVGGDGNGPGGHVINPGASPAANVTTVDAVALSKTFSPASIAQGGTSTLALTIRNRVVTGGLSNVNLIDNLPPGITLAANPAATNTCNGSLQAFPGGSQLTLTNGTVAARPNGGQDTTCTITARVTGTTVGSYINTVHPANLSTSGGTIAGDVSATLNISTGLSGAKTFNPASVTSGGTSRVTITVTNGSNGDLTNVSVDDNTFGSGLTVANPAIASTSCPGSPTMVVNPGATRAQLLGATLAAGASCAFSFDVTAGGAGPWSNTIPVGKIRSADGPFNTGAVSASLNAAPAQININKSFNPVIVTGGVPSTLTLTLTNPSGVALHDIGFTDVFPIGIQVYSVPDVTSTCIGSTVTAIPGDGKVSLAGATMAAGSTCVITLQTTSIKFLNLTNSIPAGAIESFEGYTNPLLVSATLSTLQGLGVMKAFSPAYVIPNQVSTLKMWLVSTFDQNAPTPLTLTGVSFTDTLPPGVNVSVAPGATTTCPGPGGVGTATITATPGSGLVTISSAHIVPGTICEISVDVVAPGTPGTYTNIIPADVISTDQGPTNNDPANANLYVVNQPTISKAFSPSVVSVGGTSTLTVRINNGASIPITGVSLTDTLPEGLDIAGNPAAGTDCSNGTVTADPGSATLSLSGATVPAGGSCSFSAVVVANTPGAYINNINAGEIVSNEGLTNSGPANDPLTARITPTVNKAFNPVSIASGGTSTLTITIGNSNSGAVALTSPFVDALPGNVFIAGTPASTTCTGGTLTANAGDTSITYSGGSIPNGGCTITVDVTSTDCGVHTNTIAAGQLQTNAGDNQDPAFADLGICNVPVPPTVSKSFSPGTIATNGTSTLTITLGNPNTSALTLSSDFTDNLPVNVQVAGTPAESTTCPNGTVTAVASGTSVTLNRGSFPFTQIPAAGNCTITVHVTSAAEGSYTNTVLAGNLKTVEGGNNSQPAAAALVVQAPIPPTVEKSFSPNTINPGGVSRLTITLGNVNGGSINLTADFTDTLPAGVTVAPTPNIGGTCTNANITAGALTGSITYVNGASIPSGGCTILVDVTAASNAGSPYTNTIAAGALVTSAGNNGAPATDKLFVNPPQPPSLSKSFSAAKFLTGDTVTLTISLGNGNATAATLTTDLVDTLPSGLVIATPNGLVTNCSGTVDALAGSSTLTYQSGGVIPGNSGCAISVTVKAADALPHHLFTNIIAAGALKTDLGSNAVDSTATVQVLVRPTVAKSFSLSTIKYNQVSTLTLTLGNTNDVPITLSLDLVDTLPLNVFLATPATIGGTCINSNLGKVIAANGGGTITYQSGATILAGGCTITVPVTSITLGDYTNTINSDELKTDAGTNPAPAAAPLRVLAPPTISKTFASPKYVLAGVPATLTLTLSHPNPQQALTLQSNLVDTLPGSLRVAATPNIGGTCINTNPGKVLATAGAGTITYQSGATIPIGGCTITVDVKSDTGGVYANTIASGGLVTEGGTNAAAATDTLTVVSPTMTKSISSVSPGPIPPNATVGDTITYSIGVTLPEASAPALVLTDSLPAGYQFVGGSVTVDSNSFNGTVSASPVVGTSGAAHTGQTVTIDFGDVMVNADSNGTNNTFTVTLQALVIDDSANAALASAQTKPNSVSLNYTGKPAGAITASVNNEFREPRVTITKSMSSTSNLYAGQTITITLTVINTGTSPAYDIVVTDPLPSALFDLTAVTSVNAGTTPADFVYSYDGVTVKFTQNAGQSIAASGGSRTFIFTTKVRSDVVTGSGYTFTNIAAVTGDGQNGVVAGERPTNNTGSRTATVENPVVAKTILSTSENDTDPGDVNKGANPPVAIGEVITYEIRFTIPEGVTKSVFLRDILPAGLTHINGTAFLDRSSTAITAANNPDSINANTPGTPVAVTMSATTGTISLDLGDVTNTDTNNGTSEQYILTLKAVEDNSAGNNAGTVLNDVGRISFNNNGGTTQNLSTGNISVHVAEPTISMDKSVNPAAGAGGDTVTYTLVVTNTSGSNRAPAYDLVITDPLPADLNSPAITCPGAGCNAAATGAALTATFTANTLNATIDKLDPGEAVTFTYTAKLNDTVAYGKSITNTAAYTATSLPGANGTGGVTPGAPGSGTGERTGTGGVNDLTGSDPATVTVNTPTISKSVVGLKSYYPIGDAAAYRVTMAVPVGTSTHFTLTDTIPANLAYQSGSAVVVLPPSATTNVVGSLDDTNATFFTLAGNVITLHFGTLTVPTAGNVTVDFNAIVQNVIANQDGTTFTNSATLTLDNPGGGTITVGPATNNQVRAGEPNLTLAKAITAGAAGSDAGNTLSWRIDIQNSGHTTAYQVNWNDVLPDGLYQISNVGLSTSGGNVYLNGTTNAPAAADTTVSTSAPPHTNDTLMLGPVQIDAGATLTITFDSVVMDTVTPGQVLNNSTAATYTSLVGGGRDGSGGGDDDVNDRLNNYRESASQSLTISSAIAVNKTVSPDKYTIGQDLTYSTRVSMIEGTIPSLVLTDALPAGLTYQSHSISVGNGGMTIGNGSYNTRLGTGQTVQFDFGTVTNPSNGSATDDYIDVQITARVDNILPNQNNTILRNGEQAAGSSVYVTYGSGPTRVDYDHDAGTPGVQGLPITIIEPALSITKTPTPSTQSLGDVVTYTVTVQHTGASTADAFDIVINDVLPVGLTYVPGSATLPVSDVTVADQNLQFRYASITQVESSKSFTYQARVDLSAPVGQALTNNATVTWKSLSGSDGAAHSGRTGSGGLNDYTASTSANVSVNENAVISAVKTVADLNGGILLPNETLEYTTALRNNSSPVTNVLFTDTVPANTTYLGNLTTTKGSASSDGATVTVSVGSMASGETVTIKFQVTVNNGVAAGTVISNQGRVDSYQTVPTPTDWDGIPSNGYQPTDIVVGGQPALQNALYVEKVVSWINDADSSGSITPGDRMRYTLIFHNLGQQTLTNVGLTDTIPANLSYVSSSTSASSGSVSVVGSAVTVSGVTLPVSGISTAQFDVTVGAAGTYTNQGTAASTQTGSVKTDSNGDPTDGNQPTIFTAVASGGGSPLIDVQKRWSLAVDVNGDSLASPNDTIGYTITIQNTGSAAATNVRLDDAIPANTTVIAGSDYTSQGVVLTESPLSVNIGTVNPGGLVTVNFAVTVDNGAPSCTILANQATVTGGNFSAVVSDDNGNPGDGLNATLTPVACSAVSLSKVLSATSEAGSSGSNLMIGEVATYRVTLDIPAGTTREMTITDTLPAGMSYMPGSGRLMRSFDTGLVASENPVNINAASSGVFVALTDGSEVTVSGQTVSLYLGDVINSDNDANAEAYTLELKALVLNTIGNQAGTTLDNQAGASYRNGLLQLQNLTPVNHTSTVIEPNVQIAKTATPPVIATGGGTVAFTVTLTNPSGANVATAYDVQITDALPVQYGSVTIDSITPSAGVTGVVNNTSGSSVDITASAMPAGEQVVIHYHATAAGPLVSGTTITNTAHATWTSLPGTNGTGGATPGGAGSSTGERTGAGSGVNDYTANSTASVLVADVAMRKDILSPQQRYAIGDAVQYQVQITLPEDSTYTLSTLQDILAQGLTYQTGTLSISYPSGVTASGTPGDFTRTDNAPSAGQETLNLNFGTLANSNSSPRTFLLTYQALVDNILSNQDNQSMANQVTFTFTDPGTGLPDTRTDSKTITVGEPHLTLAKTISSSSAGLDAGDPVSFQVALGNNGTMTAYDTVMTDALPAGLSNITNVNVVSAGGASTPIITNTGAQWQTSAMTVPVAGTVTVTFDARLAATVEPGQQIQNTVSATFTSRSSADPNERNGSTPGSNEDDGTLNNYNVSAGSPVITVNDPVAITKQFYPDMTKTTYTIGENVTYRITLSLIEGVVNNVTVADTLPGGLSYVSSLVGVGTTNISYSGSSTPVVAGQTLSFGLGTVTNVADGNSANDFITIDITASVDNVVGNQDGTILGNNVQLRFTDSLGGAAIRDFDADISTPGIQPLNLTVVEPNLQILKSANPSAVSLGDETTFTIVVDHTAQSTADAYDIVVTDTLPAGLTYAAGSGSPAPVVNGQQLTFTIPSLTKAQDQTSITFRARVDVSDTVGAPLTNTVSATYTSLPGPNPGERTGAGQINDYTAAASAQVTPTAASAIDAEKTVTDLNGGTLQPGDTLEYTITLTNTNGPVTNAVFTDTVPVNTAYAGGLSTTKGTAGFAGNVVTVNVGPMASAETVTIKFRVTVNSGVAAGTVISNQGAVDSDQTVPRPTDWDGNPGNGLQPTDVIVGGIPPSAAKLYADKGVSLVTDADSSGSISIGDRMRYTIHLRNIGATTLTNVTFADTIPTNLSYVSSSASITNGGTVAVTGQSVSASVPSILPGSFATLQFDVTIGTEGTFINQGTAGSDQTSPVLSDGDGNPDNGNQPTQFIAVAAIDPGAPSLTADKTAVLAQDLNKNGIVNPGDTLLYEITVRNTGSSPATNVRLTDTAPVYTTLAAGSVTTSQGVVLAGSPVSVNIGTINPGGAVTVQFRAVIAPVVPTGTSLVNTATITAAGGITVTALVSTPVASAPIISATKRVDPSNRFSPLYTVVIRNSGNAPAVGVVFADPIPAHTTYKPGSIVLNGTPVSDAYGDADGGYDQSGPSIAINIDALNPGSQAVVTFSARVNDGYQGTVSNQGTVSGSNFTATHTDDPATAGQNDPTDFTVSVVAVPTLDAWGFLILFSFAGLVPVYYLRRQRKIDYKK